MPEIVGSDGRAIAVFAARVFVADIFELLLAVSASLSFRTRALVSGQQAHALATVARVRLAVVDRHLAHSSSEAKRTRTVDLCSIHTRVHAFTAVLALVLELWKASRVYRDDLDLYLAYS